MSVRAVVIGAGGYTGAELCAILLRHPEAHIAGLFGSPGRGDRAPARLSDLFPAFRDRLDEPIAGYSASAVVALEPDAVFLATPHEASLGLVAELRARDVRVFDLSGAFRLPNASAYPKHYGFEHTQPGLLKSAVYGLAELNRDQIVGAPLVAVPGCYPTSAILPLAPLVAAGAVKPGTAPIIDSISGVSGAGRSASVNTRFCEVSVQPYNVMHHRHQPEIEHHAGVRVVFTPHIGPYDRGIVSTIHVELAEGFDAERVGDVFERAYADERFVRLLPDGCWPSVAGVCRTNCCDLGWAVDGEHGHLIVCSAIDNLVKGAAGQAVQCMNIAIGLDEASGLADAPAAWAGATTP